MARIIKEDRELIYESDKGFRYEISELVSPGICKESATSDMLALTYFDGRTTHFVSLTYGAEPYVEETEEDYINRLIGYFAHDVEMFEASSKGGRYYND